ncbi:MAG: insulinase family protein, partial [Clostridia bacterium]|nr:insulinase family protein [Clostridia bacterium]
HKMFEQPDGSDAFALFSALGADANAYTSWDKTAYLFQATENVYEALEILLRFVSSPHFTEASVKKEQGIIAEEIRMNDDSPSERCFVNGLRAMYAHNAVRNEICGTEASIARITPEVLYTCYRTFYRPQNMALVLCGPVEIETVTAIVDRVLPSLPEDMKTPRTVLRRDENAKETRAVHKSRVNERMQVGKPMFSVMVKDHDAVSLSPKERMRRDAGMMLLKELFFSTSSDLYLRLLDDGLISPHFSAGYGATSLYAFFEIAGESDDPDAVLREIRSELSAAMAHGIEEEAFLRAKRVLYAKTVKTFDGTRTVSEMLLDFVLSDYDLFEYVDLFETLTREDAQALLAEVFTDEAFAISIVSPLHEAEEENP